MPDGMPNASTSFVLTFESVGRENQFLSDTALGIQSVSLNDMGWGACEIYSCEENPNRCHILRFTLFACCGGHKKPKVRRNLLVASSEGVGNFSLCICSQLRNTVPR